VSETASEVARTDTARALGRAQWVGLKTIIIREYGRIIRIWAQTIVPSAVTSALYFVIFGSLIGKRVGLMGGVPYMQYIAPGLIMMAVITNCYGNISSSFFGAKFQRFVEEMLVSPMPSWVILTGYISGAVLRGLIVAVIVLAISLFFTHIHLYHPLITLSTVLLTAVVFSLAGFVNAIFAKKFDDIALVPTFVLTPLTYLGGVFYAVSALPTPWREISYANPILYMVNAFRYGLLGITDVGMGVAYAVMLAFAVALTAIALALLDRGVGLRS
jgi:ABC-2 type transport system permease protein